MTGNTGAATWHLCPECLPMRWRFWYRYLVGVVFWCPWCDTEWEWKQRKVSP